MQTPSTEDKVWLSSPHMGHMELEYVKEAFETNWIAPLGPHVNAFEQSLEAHADNNRKVACVSSGTAALHLALMLANVHQGDTVLCQSFTFSASANPIVYQGAKPIFIDSEPFTWNIDPKLLQKAIEEQLKLGQKPKAIVAVHLYGMPYMAKEINEIANHFKIPVIEDSAEALGSSYYGKPCGALSDLGIYSFNGNKIITTSGGGALLTKNTEQKVAAIHLATQARDNAPHYQHTKIGFNYRMSNVLAGIGRGQMKVLNERVLARRKNFDFYKENLAYIKTISFLKEPEGFYSNRWLSCILTPSFEARELIRLALEKENIESRPLWKPMHLQPIFKNELNYSNGVSKDLFERGLCLPSGSNLNIGTLQRICDIIHRVTL